jgi:hypothetical protein
LKTYHDLRHHFASQALVTAPREIEEACLVCGHTIGDYAAVEVIQDSDNSRVKLGLICMSCLEAARNAPAGQAQPSAISFKRANPVEDESGLLSEILAQASKTISNLIEKIAQANPGLDFSIRVGEDILRLLLDDALLGLSASSDQDLSANFEPPF